MSFDIERLVRETREPLLRYVGRLVGLAEADDIVQQAFAKASVATETFRGESTPKTWIFRIATNCAWDWKRARGLAAVPSDASDDEAIVDPSAPSQERQLERAEMSQCVGDVLRRLPEHYQAILALSDCEEMSDREVADVLGLTVGAAKVRLHRARARLRAELEQTCAFYRDGDNTLCCDRKADRVG